MRFCINMRKLKNYNIVAQSYEIVIKKNFLQVNYIWLELNVIKLLE